MADHPLRPAIHHRLGGPLPHQLPNGPRAHPQAAGPFGSPPLVPGICNPGTSCGITGFSGLIPHLRVGCSRVTHPFATLPAPPKGNFRVRLACLIHAASVRSEPGSNSPWLFVQLGLPSCFRWKDVPNYLWLVRILSSRKISLSGNSPGVRHSLKANNDLTQAS